jgi:hypothetical protein
MQEDQTRSSQRCEGAKFFGVYEMLLIEIFLNSVNSEILLKMAVVTYCARLLKNTTTFLNSNFCDFASLREKFARL